MIHSKFWQAFFAIAPIVLLLGAIVGYVFFLLSLFGEIDGSEDSGFLSASFIFENMGMLFLFILVSIGIYLGSLVFYIVHAVLNPNLKAHNLLLVWILLFVFLNGIGQLIYWGIEILGKRKSTL